MPKNKWEEVGYCDVDAGCVMIGDPCYYLHRSHKGEEKTKWEKQFGKDWSDFGDIILKHRHYTLSEAKEFVKKYKKDCAKHIAEEDARLAHLKIKDLYLKYPELFKSLGWRGTVNRWLKEGPHVATTQINHPLGHPGAAVVMHSGYGDGSYPVYVRYNDEGRVAEATIVFIDTTHAAIKELYGDEYEDQDETDVSSINE